MEHIVKQMYRKFNQRKGDIFGRLTYTGITFFKVINGQRRRMIEAECECGIIRDYIWNLIKRGDTKSCGCLRSQIVSERMLTHGLSKHPLYEVFLAMRKRCFVEDCKDYPNYGGRGITVCDEWVDDFPAFYKWCIENGWQPGLDLDRKENDGIYEPINCQFVSRPIGNRNTRSNRLYTAFGETKCLFDWGNDSRCVISVWGLRNRMDRGKWPDFEKALTTPEEDRKSISRSKKNNKYLKAFGEEKCMSAWLEDSRCLVKIDSLRDRLAKGWDAEKAISTPPTRDGKNGFIPSK